MSTNLSRHFEQQRLARGLRPAQLAALMGFKNPVKTGNKIRQFELSGNIHPQLFQKLAVFLEVDGETIERLVEQDRREFFARWLKWVNEPITPYLLEKLMPVIYRSVRLPADITTQEEAERWAASYAKEPGRKCCLVWSRRISIWFNEAGKLVGRTEAVPDRPNEPWIEVGGKPFQFGQDLRSLKAVAWTKKPGNNRHHVPDNRADD